MALKHENITHTIIQSCFEISNEVGVGYIEIVYKNALEIVLVEKGLKIKREQPCPVWFRGHCIGEFFADMVIEDKIILEIKAVKTLLPEHEAQILNYLRSSNLDVCFLINFGKPKIDYQRYDNYFNQKKITRMNNGE